MALNPYFLQGSSGEQGLVQDIINEQLKIYGVECYYLPRQYATTNKIIREVVESKFKQSYPIEAYVENFDGYGDNTVMLSKFGIQATNELTITISQERFKDYISPLIKNLPNINLPNVDLDHRPREGDLVYFPLGDRLFEVKFVEHEKPFYQLRKNYVYTLTCELFRPEDEILDTGIEEIDDTFDVDFNLMTVTVITSGSDASAATRIDNGAVQTIEVTNRGERYTSSPRVAITSAPSGGFTAVGIATLLDGLTNCDGTEIGSKVQGVQIINPGYGYEYTDAPGILFFGGGTDAVGAAATVGVASTGSVGIVTISDAGSGYSTPPTVTFSTPKHVGAAATAVLYSPMSGIGVSITSAPISDGDAKFMFPGGTTGGRFYKPGFPPTVTFGLPTGSSETATATATLDDYDVSGGTVLTVTMTSGGKFYDSAPTVTFSAPTASGAAATVGLAGTVINASSIAFSTTGRAYTTAPTVSITAAPAGGTTGVGIVTIHSVTGIVTAVSFNPSDVWAVGTSATVGSGYTVAPTLTFSGSTAQVRATGTAVVSAAGTVTAISIGNSGFGYQAGNAPTISIEAATGGDEEFRATGISTMRYNSVFAEGTLGIGATTITGMDTVGILIGDRVRLGVGYSDSYNFIDGDAYVTSISASSIVMSEAATNVGIATSTFEFGIQNCGIVTGINIIYGGGGYVTPPTVSISNTEGDKNYHSEVAGVTTAVGLSLINSSGIVTAIYLTNAGAKYIEVPSITVGAADTGGTGNFIETETITGSASSVTAIVRTWNASTGVLAISNSTGDFIVGETLTGSESNAQFELRVVQEDNTISQYPDNLEIETQADSILDFSETNPFGTP
tara:strand:- start:1515 stop:4055 length:2541 start_codon:yes stop_codon:yes gene_type:complete